MSLSPFIPLRVHSAFSLAEGALKINTLVELCKKHQIPAVALTDTNNLFGAMEFSLAAAKAGIQPIIGCLVSLTPRAGDPRLQEKRRVGDELLDELILLVQNETGYKNLLKLVSRLYIGSDDKAGHLPQISYSLLETYHEGLIALSGGPKGAILSLLEKDHKEAAHETARALSTLFKGRFYLELSRQDLPHEAKTEPLLFELADALNLPLVATNEVFFKDESLYEAHDALLCIAEGAYVTQDDRRRVTLHHRFKSPQEMITLFEDVPEAITNTREIARRCAFMVEPKDPMLPPFPTAKGESQEIKDQAVAGLEKRLDEEVLPRLDPSLHDETRKTYFERLTFELGVIDQMGFSGYFLIVGDFIQWAKSQDIPVGPGRGSGAGSLVAWALTITDVDPIRFALIFERFLNPERISMPDFDVDFCQERRDEVIAYVRRRYGEDHVAHIITFGKLQARAVVRDVGRVLGMPYGQVDRLSKMIPSNPANPVTLEEALLQEPDLARAAKEDPAVERLLDIGMKLEGLYRHASTHAAGVVIGGEPIDNIVPLYHDQKGILPATQFHMKHVEMAGLVKFDFLGLKTLSVIQKAATFVGHEGVPLNITTISLEDEKTFTLLQDVDTVGVFQLEGAGMRDVLKRLHPTNFEEIIALISLYRPGPMDDIPRYLACKHGQEEVRYAHPLLEGILKETYGVMVYQEQVMQIAQVLSGYTLGEADMLRRAMGKKIKSEMDQQKDIFLKGAKKNNISAPVAEGIFEQAAKFAGYGFNKCHATPYALIAYQTAYLKANYPLAFMAASMTYDMHNTDRLMLFRADMARKRLTVFAPDINKSYADFRVETADDGTKGVRYALGAIKSVGEAAMAEVVAEREARGPFTDVFDFARRLDTKIINKRFLEKLIAAGAFDSLHDNRAQLMASVELITRLAGEDKNKRTSSQSSLFGGEASFSTPTLPTVLPWDRFEKLSQEFDAIGFYLSDHPLDAYVENLQHLNLTPSRELSEKEPQSESLGLKMAGVVLAKKERLSKKGSRYAFVQLSDTSGTYEVTFFSELYASLREKLEPGALFYLQIQGRFEEGALRLTVQDARPLDQVLGQAVTRWELELSDPSALPHLKEILTSLPRGRCQLRLILRPESGGELCLNAGNEFSLTPNVKEKIMTLPGVILRLAS
ncbi:MAG: DNA polymerase III subunit alpha [Alphaproteobacteria bacterium]|nr:DNA polymerase III subunit alpha [Alphaproteobacteria bacterium]